MGWLIAGFSLVCMASCGAGTPTTPKPVGLDEDFQLAPSQTAMVGDTGLTIAFERVRSDSRCAEDVQCIWEGDAAVAVTAAQPGRDKAALDLHTTTSGGGVLEARYGEFLIRLNGLSPQPRSTRTIAPGDYRATLRVTR